MRLENGHDLHRRDVIGHGLAIVLLASLFACGGQPVAGPSPVAGPTAATTATAPLPAGIDPAYVRTLAVVGPDGRPKRWEGGPFHHCFGQGVDAAVVAAVAGEMAALTGIPRTDSGPCNVTWTIDAELPKTIDAQSELSGTETAIFTARISFHTPYAVAGKGRHEAGHVLGLNHSPRASDCMALVNRDGSAFAPDELALIAWLYRR